MPIYPASPTIEGNQVAVDRFLKSPHLIQRRVDELAAQTFLADYLFTGRETGPGAVVYEVGDGIYLDRAPEVVNPGGEYPRALPTTGTAALAKISKRGVDVPITDEKVGRGLMNEVDKRLRQVVTSVRRDVDTAAVAAATAAVTQAQEASAPWTAQTGRRTWLDIELAAATIEDLQMGYKPDTVLVSTSLYPYLAESLLGQLPREGSDKTVTTGTLPVIGDLAIAPAHFPASSGVQAMVVDRSVFGSLVFEEIPSPEYTGTAKAGVQTWVRRDPDGNDQWLVRGRRPVVPIVQEPRAAVEITGTR